MSEAGWMRNSLIAMRNDFRAEARKSRHRGGHAPQVADACARLAEMYDRFADECDAEIMLLKAEADQ